MVVVKFEIREQIVEAASHIFARFGFKKTTMDEIAQSMRKGKSSIYYYFKSKEEIFEAVVEKEAQILKSELISAVDSSNVPQEMLRSYILTRMRGFQKMSNMYEALKNDYLSHLDFINRIRRKYDESEIKTIEDILKKGVDEGSFKVENTSLASIAIVTALKGLEIPLFWTKGDADFEKQLDNVLNVLFYGIVKR